MIKFSRRLKSSLVRAEGAAVLNNQITTEKVTFDLNLSNYQTKALQEYFQQDGIMFPLETLIQKSQERDYEFFLSQENFIKVADSLEKFESYLDLDDPNSKEFRLFKRKLYTTYEVRNRTTLEHDHYSTKIELSDLYHMVDSNDTHLAEIVRQNNIIRETSQLALKGAFYKRKLLSAEKIKGLVSMAVAGEIWWSYAYLAHSYGSSITQLAMVATTLFGISRFTETNYINSLEVLPEGHENAGKVKVVIALSPIVTREFLVES